MSELHESPAVDKPAPLEEAQDSFQRAAAFCKEHQDGSRHPSSLLAEYVTGIALEDTSALAQRVRADKVILRTKYQLPMIELKTADAPSFILALQEIATRIGVSIKPSSENPHKLSTPLSNGSAYVPEIRTIFWAESQKPGELEHELVHALQHAAGIFLTTEQREYEAYCVGIPEKNLNDPELQEHSMGVMWGSIALISVGAYYESYGMENPWLYGWMVNQS